MDYGKFRRSENTERAPYIEYPRTLIGKQLERMTGEDLTREIMLMDEGERRMLPETEPAQNDMGSGLLDVLRQLEYARLLDAQRGQTFVPNEVPYTDTEHSSDVHKWRR